MKQYIELCEHILENGVVKNDRTGTGTLSIFGYQMRFNLAEGFPLVTTKDMMTPRKDGKTRFDDIVHELLWFLSGDTNIKYLVDNGVNIWNPDTYRVFKNKFPKTPLGQKDFVKLVKDSEAFASEHGGLGRIYGAQWRSWTNADGEMLDQITEVIKTLQEDPDSRRMLVIAFNPGEVAQMGLPPCHVLFQLYVSDGKLSCLMFQRSGDVFLGVPYNIASYALLTMMIADQAGLGYGEFIHTLGDAHIYLNHVDQVKEQIKREPKPLPSLFIHVPAEPEKGLFGYKRSDILLLDYDGHPELKGAVSVGS